MRGKKEEIRKDKTGKTDKAEKTGETDRTDKTIRTEKTDKTKKTSRPDKTGETGRKDGIEAEKKQKRTPLERKPESVQLDQLSEKELLGLVIAFLEKGTLPVFFQFKEVGQEEILRAVEMLWKSRQLQFAEAILPFISFRKKGPPAYLALMQLLREEWELLPEKQKRHPVFGQLKKKLGSPAKPYVPPLPEGKTATPSFEAATESSMPEEEGYFIKNAGLVILWPFMRHLFNALKLLDEKGKFLGEEQQFYAAHLLEYAATKNTVTPEYLMPFNKILCEIPFSTPLPPEIELGENAKELVESLLRAVIQQWSAIKNSSEDGLRGNFLIRDGKLVKKEKNWNLVVEQKSFDILLDRLPWGISTIKLPWMSPILYVEWR